jgi:hypothetical protein
VNGLAGIKARYDKSDFVVARSVRLSLAGDCDPDQRRHEMKIWCRDNCEHRWAKRWTATPDQVWFDFESDYEGVIFRLSWP